MSFADLLARLASQSGLPLTPAQLDLFGRYRDLLLEWNQKINLTTITSDQGIAEKHFLDSLAVLEILGKDPKLSLADIGSGAGFPGFPIKIVCSHIDLSLVESVRKKADFLNYIVATLNIKNTRIINERVEAIGSEGRSRGMFDVVVARAVSSLPVLVEYSLPLLKIGGRAIFWKSQVPTEELIAGQKTASLIGGTFEPAKSYTLPSSGEVRQLVIIRKTQETPSRFPRRPGQAEKRSADRL